ncbi:MAG: radical SAM family heme chaperone HemW [Marinoscillum sp.]
MAGIYIHIPFCKQACHYCDFHFSTNQQKKPQMVAALTDELRLRKHEYSGSIDSIYFGGGTPSLLTENELHQILLAVASNFNVKNNAEITLEANPDDLNLDKLVYMRKMGINRLSIGIQTFDDDRLKFINRAHSSQEARQSLEDARSAGFTNISADLIYALPPNDLTYWKNDLDTLLGFEPEHISLYGLTIEEKTVFGKWAKKGRFYEVPEETAASQYTMAMEKLQSKGYDHYEISNFGKPGFHSRHNSAYWDDQFYMGIGPGAHSYDGSSRAYNISNNTKYMESMSRNELPRTVEMLSETDKANEYLFTHLRTRKGIDLNVFTDRFGKELVNSNKSLLIEFQNQELLEFDEKILRLTSKGFMIADEITWRLFFDT